MEKKPINQVVAEALKHFMGDKWSNSSLGRAAKVAPNTVRNYLAPATRMVSKSGKEPSAKLTELDRLADALGVSLVELVTDATAEERQRLHLKRAADYYAQHGVLPSWAPNSKPPDRNGKPDKHAA